MKKILLPTDFSENAFNAMCYAVELLQSTTCIFFIVHAYTPALYRVDYSMGSPGKFGLPDDHQHLAETTLDKIVKRLRKLYPNPKHTYVPHAAFNTLDDEMCSVVKNENIDMIIMGTQGATGAKEVLFGSNTVHIFRKVGIPVLAVPSTYKFSALKEIAFPTDYEIDYKRTELDVILWLSKIWESKINVIHVTAPQGLTSEQKKYKRALEKMIKDTPHQVHDLPDQELINAINVFQERVPFGLLVMVKNKHSFLERLFVEPVIRNIGLHSNVPFLVLPYKSKS
ncbi:universal stress protein [Flagellimonas nanhaiensis]|uniref:Universal stress protein n=1 Tax=Flagellimonas nanhaiensis TaxID=2292706 RepID=A0A371JLX5_9FLAO|nr:universal stress protein [Allomuricauda nanhaiensis]RDY58041.1 universal stress protein [Allomuricauda nanhaiensis]